MKQNDGFTLVELLIVTSLTVLLMLAITSLFMTFLLGNSKANTKKTIKEEGAHALSQMEFLLKNAYYIDETTYPCQQDMPAIDVVSLDGGTTTLTTVNDKISSNSASLISDTTQITQALSFDCSGPVGNRQVKISFQLTKLSPDGDVTELFNSTVNVRN